jgi:S1-C subfamily serine protease
MALIEAESRRRRGQRSSWWAIIEIVVAIALVIGTAFAFVGCTIETGDGADTGGSPITTVSPSTETTAETTGGTNSPPSTVTADGGDGLASPAESVAAKLGPSVVNIAISGIVDQGPFGQQEYGGEGSGVVYTADGMIITNNHVVTDYAGDPVGEIEVTLTTGEKLLATIVGRDPLTDLAVIKVNAGMELPIATFNTDLPAVGEYAVAIGSPLGYENSVTLGIVSGLARNIEGVTGAEGVALTNLIQTDAPISPGNSGGALANANAEVIGINVAYLPPGQTGAVNIGFAIPSVTATKVADEIIETGSATHAYAGVGTQTVTPDLQEQFGLSRSSGVLVAEVTPGSPADDAGIQQGDIIVEIDGEEMVESSDVLMAVRDKKPGDTVEVTIDRDGTVQVVTVTLEERPAGL